MIEERREEGDPLTPSMDAGGGFAVANAGEWHLILELLLPGIEKGWQVVGEGGQPDPTRGGPELSIEGGKADL
jgi:hypothetical protein